MKTVTAPELKIEKPLKKIQLGAMRGRAIITGDIVGPVFDEWEQLEPASMVEARRKRPRKPER